MLITVRNGRAGIRRYPSDIPYLVSEGETQEFELQTNFMAHEKSPRSATRPDSPEEASP